MARATSEEIEELLGEDIDEAIVERIAAVGASIDEIGEAIDDLDYERRYGESRESSSSRVEEVRAILEELPRTAQTDTEEGEEEDHEGLTVITPDELGANAEHGDEA